MSISFGYIKSMIHETEKLDNEIEATQHIENIKNHLAENLKKLVAVWGARFKIPEKKLHKYVLAPNLSEHERLENLAILTYLSALKKKENLPIFIALKENEEDETDTAEEAAM